MGAIGRTMLIPDSPESPVNQRSEDTMKKLAAVLMTTMFAMNGAVFAAAHMAGEKPKNPCAEKAQMKDAKGEMKDEKKAMKKEMKDEKKEMKEEKKM